MNPNKFLVTIEKLEEIDLYKKARVTNFLFPLKGFCVGIPNTFALEEIKENNYVLTPGRYVGTEEIEDDGIPFEEKMSDLTSKLAEQMKESAMLDEEIKKVLGAIGYGI